MTTDTSTVQESNPTTSTDEEDDTTVGNYFVSNYPPYSFWSQDQNKRAFESLTTVPSPDKPLGLYVHIPFCRKRCHFCYFRVYTDKNSKEIREYMDAVLKELAIYAKQPFINGRKPKFVYFGGGTPSYLSAEQLKYLTDGIQELFPWDDVEEVTFECEPGTLNEKKLLAIRELGVTRLSLGVENFDDEVLKSNGRAHLSKQIFAAYEHARNAGFPQINIDLIAGMINETPENWQQNIDTTLRLQPDSVTIYQMEVPYNTTIYKQMQETGKIIAPVANWRTKREWVDSAYRQLEADGYTIGSAYTALKDKTRATFVYRDMLWKGADLIGSGVASFGHIGSNHFQNQHNFTPYLESIEAGKLPVYRTLVLSNEERLIREFILLIKLGTLDFSYFDAKYGIDTKTRFADQLKHLTDVGLASIDGDTLTLTREAMLRIDSLLPAFYLPQHVNARYA